MAYVIWVHYPPEFKTECFLILTNHQIEDKHKSLLRLDHKKLNKFTFSLKSTKRDVRNRELLPNKLCQLQTYQRTNLIQVYDVFFPAHNGSYFSSPRAVCIRKSAILPQ